MKTFSALLFLLLSTHSLAGHESARRNPKYDSSYYENYIVPEKSFDAINVTAYSKARYFTGENLSEATQWDEETLKNGFAKIRNTNYLASPNKPVFDRRIPWLYPNDGCYKRVQLANSLLVENSFASPSTVMAIGNLYMKTANTKHGYVSWWYHVAPIVQVNGQHFVLDPSVDPTGPMKLEDWLDAFGTPSKIKVAICGPGTSTPSTSCETKKPYKPTSGYYLNEEWNQLVRLKKDPKTILANPW